MGLKSYKITGLFLLSFHFLTAQVLTIGSSADAVSGTAPIGSSNGQTWNTSNNQWWNGTTYLNWTNDGATDANVNSDGAAILTIEGVINVRNISRIVVPSGSNLGSITFQGGSDGTADSLNINGQINAISGLASRQITFRNASSSPDNYSINGNFSAINFTRLALTNGVRVNATISADLSQSTVGTSTVKLSGADTSNASIQLTNGALLDVSASGMTVNNLRGNFNILNNTANAYVLSVNNLMAGSALDGSGIGAITSDNSNISLTLGAGTHTFELDANANTSDHLSVLSTINLGGTLVVTVLNGMVEIGDTFDLFDGTIAGSFADFSLQDISGLELSWDTSQLVAGGTGVLRVVPESKYFAWMAGLFSIFIVISRRRKN